jgi:hypothetical protein
MHRRVLVGSFALALAAALSGACGSPPDASPPNGRDGNGDGGAEKSKAERLDANHTAFLGECERAAPGAHEFCECMWGDATCKDKMPEDTVRTGFTAGCVGDHPEMKAYCECTWSEFRKTYAAVDLADADVVKSERFKTVRADALKACGSTVPETLVRDEFLKGCARDPRASDYCKCAWTAMLEVTTAAEIKAAAYDKDKAIAKIESSCAKLKPKP